MSVLIVELPSSHSVTARQALPFILARGFSEESWQRIRQRVMEKLLHAASDKPHSILRSFLLHLEAWAG